MAEAIVHYTDDDVSDGLALLDNWGLTHVLFHHSEQIVAKPRGWALADDGSLASLKSAPAFAQAGRHPPIHCLRFSMTLAVGPFGNGPSACLDEHHAGAIDGLPIERLMRWMASGDPIWPNSRPMCSSDPTTFRHDSSCDLVTFDRRIGHRIDRSDLRFVGQEAGSGPRHPCSGDRTCRALDPFPVARLGQRCLADKRPDTAEECQWLLSLAEAEADPLRVELVEWVRETLTDSPHFRPQWIVDLLDSRHEEVRNAGWEWLIGNETARNDIAVWQQLLESPYDDVRFKLLGVLEKHDAHDRREFLVKPERLDSRIAAIIVGDRAAERASWR